MITREQVADLRPGDVVEIRDPSFPGVVASGPLFDDDGHLVLGMIACIRCPGGSVEGVALRRELTVVSRAPRPLYVNSDRTEPAAADVVRNADDDDDTRTWVHNGQDDDDLWDLLPGFQSFDRSVMPARLRLLVDGTTGQVVTS